MSSCEAKGHCVGTLCGDPRQILGGTRYLLLKHPWNLTPAEQQRLSSLVQLNRRLVRAYTLKEAFQAFGHYVGTGFIM